MGPSVGVRLQSRHACKCNKKLNCTHTHTQLEQKLRRSEAEVHSLQQARSSLTSQLERLKLDSEYLRVRAHEIKSKRPKLGYAAALNLQIQSSS